jgi:hypothetical protein
MFKQGKKKRLFLTIGYGMLVILFVSIISIISFNLNFNEILKYSLAYIFQLLVLYITYKLYWGILKREIDLEETENFVIVSKIINGIYFFLITCLFVLALLNKEIKLFFVVALSLMIVLNVFINVLLRQKIISEKIIIRKEDLFNIFYINFPKVFEISMLINNKLKMNIEEIFRSENTNKLTANMSSGLTNDLGNYSSGFGSEIINKKSTEYKEVKEVKNTNSILLRTLKQKCIEVTKNNYKDLKPGQLIKILDVEFELDNEKEEIAQINSMVSGALNGNTLTTDADGQEIKVNAGALSNIILKDYSYRIKCNSKYNSFYISIPMSVDREFENNYSIFDLEIGKMTVIGIYRTDEYNGNERNTWEYLTKLGSNTVTEEEINPMKKSDSQPTKAKNKDKIGEEKLPYIDLIAIIQELDFDSGDNNE